MNKRQLNTWPDILSAMRQRLAKECEAGALDPALARCAEAAQDYQPHKARRQRNALLRFFRRLGRALPSSKLGEVRADHLEPAVARIAEEAGVPPQEVRRVIGWYAEPGDGPVKQPVCGSIPSCFDCPLAPICKFNQRKPPINRLPEEERPRERLIAEGPQALTTAELLAIIIRTGVVGESAVDLGRRLLIDGGDLRSLGAQSVAELQRHGIGPAKAAQIKAALELGARLSAEGGLQPGQPFRRSSEVFDRYHASLRDLKKESFRILMLDVKNRLIREAEVSVGNLSSSLVHPREVFRDAIREAANAVILVHNHPTGDPTPSEEDRQITQRLRQAADIIGIKVLDHIVVGDGRYVSFADEGLM